MVSLIVACEIGFWLVLLAGLATRYLLGRRRAGAVLLLCVPLVDVLLLVATVIHLRSGAQARFADGLAAVYLGVSVAYGGLMIRWADARFAHRFAGGPPLPRPPKSGPAHARHERRLWYRHAVAFLIGTVLILGGTAVVGDLSRSEALLTWIPRWGVVLAIDFVWSFSYTLWPRRAKTDTDDTASPATPTPEPGTTASGRAPG